MMLVMMRYIFIKTMVMVTMMIVSCCDSEHRNHRSDDGDGYHDADVVDVVVENCLFQVTEATARGLQAWNSLQSRQS